MGAAGREGLCACVCACLRVCARVGTYAPAAAKLLRRPLAEGAWPGALGWEAVGETAKEPKGKEGCFLKAFSVKGGGGRTVERKGGLWRAEPAVGGGD